MLHSLLAIVLLLCSAPVAPLRQKWKYEPLISDIQFLVPLNNFRGVGQHSNSQPDLSKAWKTSKKHQLTDGPYSHIPDEEFTFDDTGDFLDPPQKTVKKDLGRDKFINFKSSDQRNHNPRSSQTFYRETNSQKYVARKCKLFLQQGETQSRYKEQSSDSDLLKILCKIYVRPSVNGLDFVTPDRDSGELAWPGAGQLGSRSKGAGILGGNIDVENDPINSFLSGMHMAENNRVLENKGMHGFGGYAGNVPVGGEGYVGNVGVDGTEKGMVPRSSVFLPVFGKLGEGGKAGQDGQTYSGKDNLINYQSTVHNQLPHSIENLEEPTLIQIPAQEDGNGVDALGNGPAPQRLQLPAYGHTINIKLGDIDFFGNLPKGAAGIDNVGLGERAGRPANEYAEVDRKKGYEENRIVIGRFADIKPEPENSGENGVKLKDTIEDNEYRCLVKSLGNDKDGNPKASSSNCLHLIFLKKATQAGQPVSSAAPGSPKNLQKFRPMGGRRQWLAMGGADDNRFATQLHIGYVNTKPWLII